MIKTFNHPFKISLITCIALSALLLGKTAFAQSFSQIIVFGDSISDTGNVHLATNGEFPGEAYYQGRFSNGLVYTDYLAEKFQIPMLSSLAGGHNYAYGSAKTNSHPIPGLLGVTDQVQAYTDTLTGPVDEHALFIVFTGANDINEFLITPPEQIPTLVSKAIGDTAGIVQDLALLGAKHIIVANMPNFGILPVVIEADQAQPGTALAAANLTIQYNDALSGALKQLQAAFNEVNIYEFDTYALLQLPVQSPDAFGFSNVHEACLKDGTVCNSPNEYIFWDDIHPSTKAHKIIADAMFELVEGEYKKSYEQIYYRDSSHRWRSMPMALSDNHTWSIDVSVKWKYFQRFKFFSSLSWSRNFGDKNQDGIAGFRERSIHFTQGPGRYRITFNDDTLAYTIKKLH